MFDCSLECLETFITAHGSFCIEVAGSEIGLDFLGFMVVMPLGAIFEMFFFPPRFFPKGGGGALLETWSFQDGSRSFNLIVEGGI